MNARTGRTASDAGTLTNYVVTLLRTGPASQTVGSAHSNECQAGQRDARGLGYSRWPRSWFRLLLSKPIGPDGESVPKLIRQACPCDGRNCSVESDDAMRLTAGGIQIIR